jgi:FixJ family two-component response regulator
MPKMTGTELAKVVKNEWPDIPVLLATGYADRLPRDDIGLPKLTKPFMQRDLAEAIVRMNPPRRKPERVVSLRPRSACARAVSGHAAAEPAIALMKSRRRT